MSTDTFISALIIGLMCSMFLAWALGRTADGYDRKEWERWVATCAMTKPRVGGIPDREQCVHDAIISGATSELK